MALMTSSEGPVKLDVQLQRKIKTRGDEPDEIEDFTVDAFTGRVLKDIPEESHLVEFEIFDTFKRESNLYSRAELQKLYDKDYTLVELLDPNRVDLGDLPHKYVLTKKSQMESKELDFNVLDRKDGGVLNLEQATHYVTQSPTAKPLNGVDTAANPFAIIGARNGREAAKWMEGYNTIFAKLTKMGFNHNKLDDLLIPEKVLAKSDNADALRQSKLDDLGIVSSWKEIDDVVRARV